MPDEPTAANTEDRAVTEYDAERRARMERDEIPGSNPPLLTAGGAPEMGPARECSGEDAVIEREIDV